MEEANRGGRQAGILIDQSHMSIDRARNIFSAWFARTGDHREAARAAGLSERTGRRWKHLIENSSNFVRPSSHNLATPVEPLFGHEKAVERLKQRLSAGVQLLTLVGPPGVGKSRLTLEFAWRMVERYRQLGGIWWCSCVDVETVEALCHVLCLALGADPPRAEEVDAQVEYFGKILSQRGPQLVVLDDFERLVTLAPRFFPRWLSMAPETTFVVTSRIALDVRGEQIHDLLPLDVSRPDSMDSQQLQANAAVQLFMARAQVRGHLASDDATLTTVFDIVSKLDGIPLAIELAAARTRILSPAEILSRLNDPWELLKRPQSLDRRHGTMLAAIEYSWRLMSPSNQQIFLQCSIFSNGFTLDAAEKVIDGHGLPDGTTLLDALAQLVDHSLLRFVDSPFHPGEKRLDMYEIIKQFARDKLIAQGEMQAVELRHAQYYLTLLEMKGADQDVYGQSHVLDQLRRELPNLMLAYGRAKAGRLGTFGTEWRVRTLGSLDQVLYTWDPLYYGMVAETFETMDWSHLSPALISRALTTRGCMGREASQRMELLKKALEISVNLGDTRREGTILRNMLMRGTITDTAEARACFDRSWSVAEARGDLAEKVRVMHFACYWATIAGNSEWVKQLLVIWQQLQPTQDSTRRGFMLVFLAMASHSEGRLTEAIGHFEAAADNFRRLGHRAFELEALSNLCAMYVEVAQDARAIALLQYVHRESTRADYTRIKGLCAIYRGAAQYFLGDLHSAASSLGQAREWLMGTGNWWGEEQLLLILTCAVAAQQDQLFAAENALALARTRASSFAQAPLQLAVGVCEGHLDLLHARRAHQEGKVEASTQALARARSCLEHFDIVQESAKLLHIRLVRRSLQTALERWNLLVAPNSAPLLVSEDGSMIRLPDGTKLDVKARGPVRRLFCALLERRLQAPGSPTPVTALFEKGWPGERAVPDAIVNRVRVAIATLRNMGLKEYITTLDGGYLIDPSKAVQLTSQP